VLALKDLIAKSIDKQKLPTKRAVMQLFSWALPEFSKDPQAVFNFMDIAMSNQPLPQDYPAYLQEFFLCIYKKHLELGEHQHLAFDLASNRLSERLLDSFLLHMVRKNLEIRPGMPDGLKTRIELVEKAIESFIPCTSIQMFSGLTDPVYCESSCGEHGDIHQSSKTYTEEVPAVGLLSRWWGSTKVITKSCRWEGKLDRPTKCAIPGWLAHTPVPDSRITAATFFPEHKKLLTSQQQILSQLDTPRLCLACLLNIPTEFLRCKHKLCGECCQELLADGIIECPFCNEQNAWKRADIPDGAGFRVLTIDGGGVRGVISAVLLSHIETLLNIPLHQLFDFIIGTSIGGLNSVGFGALNLRGPEMVQHIIELSESAFKSTAFLGNNSLGWLYYGYKYRREPLHDALTKILPESPMFGSCQLPRVAMVACEVSDGKPRIVLFSTYNSMKNKTVKHEVRGTLLQAAQAATAAGTYFPVIIKEGDGRGDGDSKERGGEKGKVSSNRVYLDIYNTLWYFYGRGNTVQQPLRPRI
jgi:hypothetical protein